ncbi:VWA domain-containing protein [Desulfofundulus salinus]|uniref:VWA domain-containing protein n=1 Tax=Desulfofundulus salinus TaxID=2419843 RepID=A0A494X2N1_9FIRM|nr:VWA domain-containing protein [Desulfofundulus salinum]RKO67094.1 VWA domain-containing protein [Desulfofundulus salinum]
MVGHLIGFIQLLRQAGIPVSTGEMLDLLQALSLLEPTRKNLLLAMQATLIKETGQERILEKLFDLYWTTLKQKTRKQEQPTNKTAIPIHPPRLSREEFNARLAQMKEWLRQALKSEDDLPAGGGEPAGQGGGKGNGPEQGRRERHFQHGSTVPLAAAGQRLAMIIAKDSEEDLKALAREAVFTLVPPAEDTPGEDPRQMLKQLKTHLDWAQVKDWLERSPLGGAEKLRQQKNLLRLERLLNRELEQLRCKRQPEKELPAIAREANLSQRCFAELDPEQVIQVKRQVARLGRRLATRAGYRRIPATRGAVDISRTVRLAATIGGVPIILCHQGRQATRPDLVVLCDLSGSVAPYSQFMMLLVHTMQNKFRMVRSYAFVDAIAEVTVQLRELDLERTVRNIQRQTGIWRTGFSDYGAVWHQFFHEHLHVLHRKVTLIILGDARNNYKPSGEEYFREICRRVRQVIWLNPTPQESWNQEDSIMHLYTPYCRHVFECRNLSQLTRIARQIF